MNCYLKAVGTHFMWHCDFVIHSRPKEESEINKKMLVFLAQFVSGEEKAPAGYTHR